ncbi:EVE domain-containing protein [Sandaracinobacter sp. RS1-74]|uniref:EVE domain-containing protein n=1 Tax=Sandaracinobacteroides sayramensis TaxID=2913411 RepID=UPI001EDABB22|nr:EVE domain-containing protein [Sandaracinobacteroides sayramensis]MCG2841941.1 EVE domain-containing protein [Sandaracinobacteroides sayramensis]
MNRWLLKSEPDVYSWAQLVAEGETVWNGVRNNAARLNLRAMKVGDEAFFYHSNIGKEVVGICRISREAYPDPTDESGKWVAVSVQPVRKLPQPVTLAAMKAEPALADFQLIRQSRLSVVPVRDAEWELVLRMAGSV